MGMETNCLALSRPLSSMRLWIISRITFSNSLVGDERLIGCKFSGNFGFLPGVDNIVTSASFQGFGK
jgi:hypothetical protein